MPISLLARRRAVSSFSFCFSHRAFSTSDRLSSAARSFSISWTLVSCSRLACSSALPAFAIGHSKPLRSQFLDLLHNLAGQDLVWTKPHPRGLRLVDAVLLTLAADVILEFGYQASFFSRGSVD